MGPRKFISLIDGAAAAHLCVERIQRLKAVIVGCIRFLSARLIKIIGNSLKGPFYLFHLLFPDKRFKIPRLSEPLIKMVSSKRIPKIIWQTNFTDRVTIADDDHRVRLCVL